VDIVAALVPSATFGAVAGTVVVVVVVEIVVVVATDVVGTVAVGTVVVGDAVVVVVGTGSVTGVGGGGDAVVCGKRIACSPKTRFASACCVNGDAGRNAAGSRAPISPADTTARIWGAAQDELLPLEPAALPAGTSARATTATVLRRATLISSTRDLADLNLAFPWTSRSLLIRPRPSARRS
jgi:hypothetical protein